MQTRRITTICAALMALAAFSVPAFAQGPQPARGQGRNGGRRVNVAALPVETIDAIVGLNADQKSKIAAIHDKYEADIKALRPAPGAQPDPANRQKLTEASRQATQDIENVLNADQKTKLQAALKDMAALSAAGIPLQVVPDLKLTADQKRQIAYIAKDAQAKMAALSPEDRRSKGRELRNETRDKVLAVLTADQKATLEKYLKEHPRGGNRRNNNPPTL